jgi:NAD(P)-dependent dehydrogenase (short-subunit alcohol dehydrogenase family)
MLFGMKARRENIFLTGASSGIGRATAELLTRKGHVVWGTSRSRGRLPNGPGFHPIEMQLEDPASIQEAWTETLRQAGHIDVVIQNAGAGIFGSIEEVTREDARNQWRVLVNGPLQVLQLAAAHLRERRTGVIIGVSSLAAELPMPFSVHYSAGKAAFSSLLAGLAMELRPFGVQVVDLRPGDIRTAFNDQLPKIIPHRSPYLPWTERAWRECARLMIEAPPPERIARGILRLVRREKLPAVARMGTYFQAVLGPIGVRILPQRMLLNSIRHYYGLHQIDEREQPRP